MILVFIKISHCQYQLSDAERIYFHTCKILILLQVKRHTRNKQLQNGLMVSTTPRKHLRGIKIYLYNLPIPVLICSLWHTLGSRTNSYQHAPLQPSKDDRPGGISGSDTNADHTLVQPMNQVGKPRSISKRYPSKVKYPWKSTLFIEFYWCGVVVADHRLLLIHVLYPLHSSLISHAKKCKS